MNYSIAGHLTVVRLAVFEFIEGWYNPHPRHSSIGYESPPSYEQKHPAHATASSAAGKEEQPVSADTRGVRTLENGKIPHRDHHGSRQPGYQALHCPQKRGNFKGSRTGHLSVVFVTETIRGKTSFLYHRLVMKTNVLVRIGFLFWGGLLGYLIGFFAMKGL